MQLLPYCTHSILGILIAILQKPLFEVDTPASVNYGSIGTFIGHEITHGFDNMGRFHDETGKVRDWWSKESLAKFEEKSQCFVQQYGAIVDPITGLNVSQRKKIVMK